MRMERKLPHLPLPTQARQCVIQDSCQNGVIREHLYAFSKYRFSFPVISSCLGQQTEAPICPGVGRIFKGFVVEFPRHILGYAVGQGVGVVSPIKG
jgi:hypothetical protein